MLQQAAAVGGGAMLAGCSGVIEGEDSVPIHNIDGSSTLTYSVAREFDLLEERGVTVDDEQYVAPNDLYSRLQAGELESFWGSPLVMARSHAQTDDVRIVWGLNAGNNVMWIGPSDVDDIRDLEGTRVGSFPPSSSTHLLLSSALDTLYDLDFEEDFDFYDVAPPVAVSQLLEGELDSAVVLPPLGQQLYVRDEYDVIALGGDLYREATGREFPIAVCSARVPFYDDNHDAINSMYDALREAVTMIDEDPHETLVETGLAADVWDLDDSDVVEAAAADVGDALAHMRDYGTELSPSTFREDLEFVFEDAVENDLLDEMPDDDLLDGLL